MYSSADINECQRTDNLCINQTVKATCVNTVGAYMCQCKTGYQHPSATNDKTCVGKSSLKSETPVHAGVRLGFIYLLPFPECVCIIGMYGLYQTISWYYFTINVTNGVEYLQ